MLLSPAIAGAFALLVIGLLMMGAPVPDGVASLLAAFGIIV